MEINDTVKIINGDCLTELDKLDANSIDCVVTDPPYELNFMGKGWDNAGVSFNKETWAKCLRVLKPGGHLLAFGGTRTYHRIACAIEDAGFEIRDTIMWLYGCLSDDTEILTRQGFKQFHKITENDIIRVYDTKSRVYKWEKPERWNVYKTEQDTCYRIKSDSTDQLVSRNHRCLVERGGKLVFEFAENLNDMERVPILSYDIPFIQEGKGDLLFTDLLWQDERLAEKIFSEWSRQEEPEKIALRRNEPKLERWCDLPKEKRKLYQSKNKVCEVPEGVYDDGEKRWVCDGAQANGGTTDKQTFIKNRSCPSCQPQCRGQQAGESDAICNEPRTQAVREWETYKTTLATVTKEEYSGYLFCPTVSTGCFVARRAGKVFITGNSGFPKSMDISKALDKKEGNKRPIVGYTNNAGIAKKAKPDATGSHIWTGNLTSSEAIGDFAKQWQGWGTALKPSYEPIIVARKPFKGSLVDNVIEYGVGGINIDECRVAFNGDKWKNQKSGVSSRAYQSEETTTAGGMCEANENGRFPANTILTYDETDYDEVCGNFPNSGSGNGKGVYSYRGVEYHNKDTSMFNGDKPQSPSNYNDTGSASRYFYCAKASRRDRDEGLEEFMEDTTDDGRNTPIDNPFLRGKTMRHNTHPTVKPTSLMQYLIRLVAPKGATILDPFMGSGSTGKAVMYENKDRDVEYKFIGIEKEQEYCKIAEARIKSAMEIEK